MKKDYESNDLVTDKINVEREIYKIKENTKLWDLNANIPGEFYIFVQYCRNLSYSETPNYEYLRMLLVNLFKLHKFTIDNIFCWNDA